LASKQNAGDKSDSTLMGKSSMGSLESIAGQFERDSWPELSRLAKEQPEAGIHFQGQ
jgi:hypothetical protein